MQICQQPKTNYYKQIISKMINTKKNNKLFLINLNLLEERKEYV